MRILLSGAEAARLLQIDYRTFKKIVEQEKFTKVEVGTRFKYIKSELERFLSGGSTSSEPVKAVLNLFATDKVRKVEIDDNIFDLRGIVKESFGPYGLVSLLCEILDKVRTTDGKIKLIVENNPVCRYLKTIGFLNELEERSRQRVFWDKSVLQNTPVTSDILVPLSSVRTPRGELKIVERLTKALFPLGFNEDFIAYLSSIIGEMSDNSMTHSGVSPDKKLCYFVSQRFTLNSKRGVVMAIADMGMGIHRSMLSNKKHKDLTNREALLSAFRPFFSSYADEHKRGKGLTDALAITWGNRGFFKIDSSDLSCNFDFKDGKPQVRESTPITRVSGTRITFGLFDEEFAQMRREDVDQLIVKYLGGQYAN